MDYIRKLRYDIVRFFLSTILIHFIRLKISNKKEVGYWCLMGLLSCLGILSVINNSIR